ncbi:hypothetical protein AAZV13_12G123966 [Glycine max]
MLKCSLSVKHNFANQVLLAYGLSSSRRAPDAIHPYGYSKERFVWSLISAVGIFCLGSGATIVNGVQNLWIAQVFNQIGCLKSKYLTSLCCVCCYTGSVMIEFRSLEARLMHGGFQPLNQIHSTNGQRSLVSKLVTILEVDEPLLHI